MPENQRLGTPHPDSGPLSLSSHKPQQFLKINLLCVVSCPGFTAPEASGSAQQLVPCPEGTETLTQAAVTNLPLPPTFGVLTVKTGAADLRTFTPGLTLSTGCYLQF